MTMKHSMRHRSPPQGSATETGDVLEGRSIADARRDVGRKGRASRDKFRPSLRLCVLVAFGCLCGLLYTLDFLSKGHSRATSSATTLIRVGGSRATSPSTVSSARSDSSRRPTDGVITECGIWMAPSSLRPNPGFGIFTTRDIGYEESILHQPDAVSVPLHDMRRLKNMPLAEERRNLWVNVFGNYVWARGVPDHNRYDNPPDMVDFQPGFGSLPNHHCLLASLAQAPTAEHPPYSDAILYLGSNSTETNPRQRRHGESPGTGAFSYSLGRDFYAKRILKAGEEIFLNYGYCERTPQGQARSGSSSWMQTMIYPDDVKEASRILKMHHPFGSKPWPVDVDFAVGQYNAAIRNVVMEESGNKEAYVNANPEIVISILSKLDRHKLYDSVKEIYNLPKQDIVHMMGSRRYYKDSYEKLFVKKMWFEVAKLTLEPAGKSDPEWIKENGQCLENLIPKKSTIPDAGFGGFAQFPIKQGEIVVPAPALHVINKETLMLFGWDSENPEENKIGMSLLMNYCLGHPESSLLLCPMTSAILLNHCSERTMDCGTNGPNAKIRWSSGWDAPSHEWRSKTLDEMKEQGRRLLSLEVVALRDISPGEEVFIDYGVEWEAAWQKHVRHWTPPEIGDRFVSAQEANERKGPIIDDLISGDLRERVNHPYLFTGCQYWESTTDQVNTNYTQPNKDWKRMSDEEILATYASSGKEFKYGEEGYAEHHERSHWPCSVIRQEASGRYTVRIHPSPLPGVKPPTTEWGANNLPRILTNYKQESIHYFVKPSAIDQKLPGVFRHPIGIPDDMFPTQWKNLPARQFKNATSLI